MTEARHRGLGSHLKDNYGLNLKSYLDVKIRILTEFSVSMCFVFTILYSVDCTVGWVNLYQKFDIEKYAVCGKLIFPKKWKDIF